MKKQKKPFKRFVDIGRVSLVNYGETSLWKTSCAIYKNRVGFYSLTHLFNNPMIQSMVCCGGVFNFNSVWNNSKSFRT